MRRLMLAAALLLVGCGSQLAGPSSPAGPSTVTATSGQFSAAATPARVVAGGTVHVTLTVAGPIDYEVGCVQTLHIWAEDSKGAQIWAQPVPAIMCMALGKRALASGESASFDAQWPSSSDLHPGTYTIHGLFLTVLPPGAGARVRENLPPLTITLTH